MRRLTPLLVALLASGSLAHSETVAVTTSLTPMQNAVRVEADLVGQTSGLPIRGAAVEVRVSRATTGVPRAEAVAGADLLGRATLTAGEAGRYSGTLTLLPAGRYLLTVVDTTYRGEAAVAARAFAFAGQPTRVTVVLPATSTPGRYVVSALLGLLAPLLVLGVILAARKPRQQRQG
ncbi:hypothetical protein [Deinococcus budaensis]|uniref:Carboxypeptidase regulatory-like domain-containing protein n=1 Tax=Deinococcus budaensis TaxID=1665626 RepID=A0A7W8GEU9_9DEIO|nr:hypothetical protein [Deinococcus budaensis]MBB5234309.1 hypothetical protein [Deinococcus budaensis]